MNTGEVRFTTQRTTAMHLKWQDSSPEVPTRTQGTIKDGPPLHFASQASSRNAIQQLLAAGADVDTLDAHGNTPLLRAVFNYRGDCEAIRLLRQAGSDPYRLNSSGVSPIALARSIANYDVSTCFSDLPQLDASGT